MKNYSTRLGVIFIAFVSFGVAGYAQTAKERVIERLLEKNEPVEIIDTKVNGQSVTLGQKFRADDDWITTVVFTVKNRSDKRILFASVDLFFPRPDGSNPMFDVFYGNWRLQNQPPAAGEQLIGFAPDETVEIGLSAQRRVGLTSFLKDAQLPQSIDKVSLRFGSIIFDDDTMWSRSTLFRRDPSNPMRWNNVSP